MATTQKSYAYKQYMRTRRLQYPEEKFNLGMQFTDTPLTEGFFKLAVNYDLKDGGEALQPRNGLRVSELAVYATTDGAPLTFSDNLGISAGHDCVEADNKSYRQLVLGEVTDNKIANTTLYEGQAHVSTVFNETAGPYFSEEIKTFRMSDEPLSATALRFRRPEQAVIHGIAVNDVKKIAKHVGTFAFGNSYYYFKGAQQLFRTVLSNGKYIPEAVPVKGPTPKEAVLWGYNMLMANPYVFTDTETSGIIQLLGLLPYDADNNIIMSPQINQTVKLRCYYAGVKANKYKVYWDWKEPGGASWTTFKMEDFDLATLPALTAELSPPSKEIMVRVTAYKYNGTVLDTVAEKVLTVGFNFNKEAYGNTANLKVESYDLSTCTGMAYWQNQLILYGVPKDKTILWLSDVNDPGYFPYPNGIDTFDEPIIYVTPILDNLLVFTATKLHLLTRNVDGLTWTKKTIQGNLDIKDWDIHLIKVVKNMVFFKSGNYYYMVVPKASSTTGELTIAPVSKYIESFLDNFQNITREIIKTMYNYTDELLLNHYYNFLDFEDVHNVYVFQTTLGVYLNFDLLYNTVLRVWRCHIYESQNILQPYKQDATKKGILIDLAEINQRFTGPVTKSVPALQFFQFNNSTACDLFIPSKFNLLEAVGKLPQSFDDLETKFELAHKLKNYQLLDLGYREHSTDYNKRYRELQLKFNNVSQKTLWFSTEFTLDGDIRAPFYKYAVHQNVDPQDPSYGLIYLEPVPQVTIELPGASILGETDSTESDGFWALDVSAFPEMLLWKARIPISGKGKAPKLRLLSRNEERYELLNISWVLRMMNSR